MAAPRSPAVLAAVGICLTLVLASLVTVAVLRTGNSVSENAALIGAVIALGGVITTQLVNTGLEAQRAREAALQKYFEQVGKLLIEQSGKPNVATVARAQTLAVLEGLDPERKRILLQFLSESKLISGVSPKIKMKRANLRDANLNEAELKEANLERARLRRAKLSKADMKKAKLRKAKLGKADLSEAELNDADLSKAVLEKANLNKANLSNADLSDADLSGAKNLTQEQIDKAVGDDRTKLPDHLQHPAHWSKGDAVQLKVQPKVGVERK